MTVLDENAQIWLKLANLGQSLHEMSGDSWDKRRKSIENS